uniref:C2H2-type domain-containing protein n=1 Tax=Romanomermis culicivorax TaxID=13658 RepID=A0A915KYY9_ROMCU
MPAFMDRSNFCEKCNIGYCHKEDHKCNHEICPCCNNDQKYQFGNWVKCIDCNRWFMSRTCFDNHKNDKIVTKKGKVQK